MRGQFHSSSETLNFGEEAETGKSLRMNGVGRTVSDTIWRQGHFVPRVSRLTGKQRARGRSSASAAAPDTAGAAHRPLMNTTNSRKSSCPRKRADLRERMELAGLEPATSWVRSMRSSACNLACSGAFVRRAWPSPNTFPNSVTHAPGKRSGSSAPGSPAVLVAQEPQARALCLSRMGSCVAKQARATPVHATGRKAENGVICSRPVPFGCSERAATGNAAALA